MSPSPPKHPHWLFLGMYPIEPENKAAAVRIRSLRDALHARLGNRMLFVCGTMGERRRQLLALWRRGALTHVTHAYVESHSTSATELELLLLGRLRGRGCRTLIYIRDAYPMFRELATAAGVRGWCMDRAFHFSAGCYLRHAQRLGFPSQGLADVFDLPADRVVLLPPGMHPPPPATPPAPDGRYLLVGGSAGEANGVEDFVAVAQRFPKLRFTWSGQARYTTALDDWDVPPNLDIVNWTRDAIVDALPTVKALMIPRKITRYTDLCVPIKLMDYMSWGRPIIATRCLETARLLQAQELGIIVDDNVEGLAAGVAQVEALPETALADHPRRSALAAEHHAWAKLAAHICTVLEEIQP